MNNKDGGPAFPVLSDCEYVRSNGASIHALDLESTGMSLRDWFAGQALAGLMAASLPVDDADDPWALVAAWSYAAADAMLAAQVFTAAPGRLR